MLRLSETRRFLQSSSFWEARCALIGQLSSALCIAEALGSSLFDPALGYQNNPNWVVFNPAVFRV